MPIEQGYGAHVDPLQDEPEDTAPPPDDLDVALDKGSASYT